jgi:hypothetical protein
VDQFRDIRKFISLTMATLAGIVTRTRKLLLPTVTLEGVIRAPHPVEPLEVDVLSALVLVNE